MNDVQIQVQCPQHQFQILVRLSQIHNPATAIMCNPKPALVQGPITLTLLYNLAAILQSLNKYIVYHHFMCPKKFRKVKQRK
jgi:hypothetical protein